MKPAHNTDTIAMTATVRDVAAAVSAVSSGRKDKIFAEIFTVMDKSLALYSAGDVNTTVHSDMGFSVRFTDSYSGAAAWIFPAWHYFQELLERLNRVLIPRGLCFYQDSDVRPSVYVVRNIKNHTLARVGFLHPLRPQVLEALYAFPDIITAEDVFRYVQGTDLVDPVFRDIEYLLPQFIRAQHMRWSRLRAAFVAAVVLM
jgi:hypothetical protein